MTTVIRKIKDQIPQSVKRRYHDRRRDHGRAAQGTIEQIQSVVRQMETKSVVEVFRETLPTQELTTEVPTQIRAIEINDSCNLDCVMCRTSLAERGKKGLMKIDKFEEAVAILSDRGMRTTNFHTLGDPIANRNLGDYLEILRKYDVALTNLSTNGLMMKRHLDTLFEYRDYIGMIRPSIDAATKETYERIRLGGNWEELHENLIAFTERNEKAPHPFTVVCASIVAKENWGELAMIPHVFSYLTSPENFSYGFLSTQEPTLSYFLDQSLYGDDYLNRAPCSRNWESIFVLKNGDLTTCCQDYYGDLIFGNVFKDNVEEVYNGEFLQGIRKAHVEMDVEAMPRICQQCYVVDPRLDDFLNGVFQYFFRHVKKHPIYLQQALNEIKPLLQKRAFSEIIELVEAL